MTTATTDLVTVLGGFLLEAVTISAIAYLTIYFLITIRWYHIAPDHMSHDATPIEIASARGKAIGLALAWPVLFGAASVMACWKVATKAQLPE